MKTEYNMHEEPYTEIFINNCNGITIAQDHDQGSDTVVFYSRMRVESLIKSLNSLLEIATFDCEQKESEEVDQ